MSKPCTISVSYEGEAQKARAEELAARLQLKLDNTAPHQLLVTAEKLELKIHPFKALSIDFSSQYWQPRRDAGKKQGIIKACKPVAGMKIIDATAGWGRDAAVLASFGSDVLMLERNPIMIELLKDGLARQDERSKINLKLTLCQNDANAYLDALSPDEYPDLIYIDPMHPIRQKSALVKKDLQALQYLIPFDESVLQLIALARKKTKQKVVVKWPAHQSPLLPPQRSIDGKTVRFDIYGVS